MNSKRVVITGLGIISGAGKSVDEFWKNIIHGHSGIRDLPMAIDNQMSFSKAAWVSDFDPKEYLTSKLASRLDLCTQYALIAANEAIAQSNLQFTDELRYKTGIVTGSCIGGQNAHEMVFEDLYRDGKKRAHPLTIPRVMLNAGASQISIEYGIKGPTQTISTACSSSNHAIGQAYWMIKQGLCDVCIGGGYETPLAYGFLKAWEAIRVISKDTCRPFSKNRNGTILGEGAGMLVIENLDHAIARNAEILGEIVGFGMSSDAAHQTMPDPDGAVRAMQMAIDTANISLTDIDYINAHGTGTKANDPNETMAIKSLFGTKADNLLISSTKAVHGHALGASAAFEAIATIKSLYHGIVPPTANYMEPDPECDLDYVPNKFREVPIRYALSNSFAFGGLNAVLTFKKWTE